MLSWRLALTIKFREDCNIVKNYRINHRIRAPEVRLVRDARLRREGIPSSDVMSRNDALSLARDQGLDLVEVGPDQKPPVVRLMDYGKFKFKQAKKDKLARRASRATSQLKKVRLTTKIAENDIVQKTKQVQEFLQDGAKVQVFVRFRGREQAHPELAMAVLRRVATGVSEYAHLEQKPTMYGRNLSMLLSPKASIGVLSQSPHHPTTRSKRSRAGRKHSRHDDKHNATPESHEEVATSNGASNVVQELKVSDSDKEPAAQSV